MKAAEKIWWTKLAAAVGVAIITSLVQLYFNVSGSVAFMLGVLLYMGISDLLSNLNGVDRMRGLKIGVGAYTFTWLTTWVLLYTIAQTLG